MFRKIGSYHLSGMLACVVMACHADVNAAEAKVKGIVDVRASYTDSLESYLHGGYGKFSSNDGSDLSLAQLGLEGSVILDNGIEGHLVVNGYADSEETEIGVTEAYLKYKSLPNESGYRLQTKAGIFYPKISLENNAIAWSSKHTLNSSSLNTWLAEEVRSLGGEMTLTRLGRLTNDAFDVSLTASAFVNNDPTGALISWHGWTLSQRQTLWTEVRKLPDFEANRPGNALASQAGETDPFLELDDRIGFHLNSEVKFHRKGLVSLGYYNNNAQPYTVENGQYAWKTRFMHAGVQWKLPLGVELTGQYLQGDTLMQSPDRIDMVDNDYQTGFIMLSKKLDKRRFTVRLEEFSVTDNDVTPGDDNNEYGKAATFNVSQRLAKQWFISAEYLWINSTRQARSYINEPVHLVERQLQLGARFYF